MPDCAQRLLFLTSATSETSITAVILLDPKCAWRRAAVTEASVEMALLPALSVFFTDQFQGVHEKKLLKVQGEAPQQC